MCGVQGEHRLAFGPIKKSSKPVNASLQVNASSRTKKCFAIAGYPPSRRRRTKSSKNSKESGTHKAVLRKTTSVNAADAKTNKLAIKFAKLSPLPNLSTDVKGCPANYNMYCRRGTHKGSEADTLIRSVRPSYTL